MYLSLNGIKLLQAISMHVLVFPNIDVSMYFMTHVYYLYSIISQM